MACKQLVIARCMQVCAESGMHNFLKPGLHLLQRFSSRQSSVHELGSLLHLLRALPLGLAE